MRSDLYKCLLLFLLGIYIQPDLYAHENGHTNSMYEDYVLVVNSYTEASDWSKSLLQTTYNTCLNYGETMVYTEHMYVLTMEKEKDVDDFWNNILHLYAPLGQPKVIVLLGNPAYGILHSRIRKEWPTAQILLCGQFAYYCPTASYLYKPDKDRKPLLGTDFEKDPDPYLKVIHLKNYPKESIELIKTLLPKVKNLFFLSDGRYMSRRHREDIFNLQKIYFKDLNIRFLQSDFMTDDALFRLLHEEAENDTSAVLYLSWDRASSGIERVILSSTLPTLLNKIVNVPIFSLSNTAEFSKDMLGGVFNTSQVCDSIVHSTLYDMLYGSKKEGFKLVSCTIPSLYINYPALKKFNINPSLYPENAIFDEKPESLWSRYKYYFILATSCLIALIGWIVYLKNSKRQADMLLKSQKERRDLIDNMPIVYVRQRLYYDEKGELIDYKNDSANPAFLKHFGTVSEFEKYRVGIKETASDILQLHRLVIKEKKEISFSFHYEPTGCTYIVMLIPPVDNSYMDVFCIDNTQLEDLQTQLRDANHKLAMALEVANMVPWRWDLKRQEIICDMNKPVENIISGNKDDFYVAVPYQKYFSMISKKDRARIEQAYNDLIQGNLDKVHEEYRIVLTVGDKTRYEWVEAQAKVEKWDENGQPLSLVGSSLVITERKQMEIDLLTAKERAEESNKLKSAFLANMSHEIRTPLNAIVGFSEVLATSDELEEKKEYLEIIENNNELLLQLIGDILDLSKIEAGTLEFNYSDFDLNTLCKELEKLLRQRVKNEKVELKYVEPLSEVFVHLERNRITQVFINLITNSIKFTNKGSISFGFRIEKENNELYFYVKDTGCGIAPEQKEKVFDRFIKLNNFVQGTGLGLSICKLIINQMGGEIGVESEEGQGTTFWFKLPYVEIKEHKKHTPLVADVIEKQKVDKLKVLIAEDNESNYKLFESILKKEYEIYHAWDGAEAIEMAAKYQPHIVLMDINMPKVNGYEATKSIKEFSTVPIIAVTAYAYSDDERDILSKGFDAYASKPVHAAHLKELMSAILKKRLIF